MDALDLFRLPLAALILLVPALVVGWAWGPQGAGWLPRVVWGLGASLAILMVGGLLLNAVHALGAKGWLLALVLLVMVSGLYWFACQLRPGQAANRDSPAVWRSSPAQEGLGGRQAVMLLAALGIVVGAVSVARAGAEASLRRPSTELWAVAGKGKIVVGVRNREGQVMNYRIELTSGDKVLEAFDVPAMAANSVYEHTLPVTFGASGANASTQVQLYRTGETTVYRHVSFTN